MNYTHRYIARICIEAESALSIGSGEKGLNTDRLVARDANGLPYIPGTGLVGVLRHSFQNTSWVNEIFGSGGTDGKGSRLIVSSAFLVGEDGHTIMDGLRKITFNEGYYSYFDRLPERDHVRINDKGTADVENHGKFDEELVHKGTRFVFEIELIASKSEEDKEVWYKLISGINSPMFRVGAGTRKGFGKLKVITENSKIISLDLRAEKDLTTYLNKSGSLNDDISSWDSLNIKNVVAEYDEWENFSLKLRAKDFIFFSAGIGDEDADNTSKVERFFVWDSGRPILSNDQILIPASSIKGALSHRVAYHYNALVGAYIEELGDHSFESQLDVQSLINVIEDDFGIANSNYESSSSEWDTIKEKIEGLQLKDINEWSDFENNLKDEMDGVGENKPTQENNNAIKKLFGYSKNSEKVQHGLRGRVLIDDIYQSFNREKVFNHTKIDRFTNETIDGALFQEKVYYPDDQQFDFEIWVNKEAFSGDDGDKIRLAFEKTLEDLKKGRLPLGGSTAKGHGSFVEIIK